MWERGLKVKIVTKQKSSKPKPKPKEGKKLFVNATSTNKTQPAKKQNNVRKPVPITVAPWASAQAQVPRATVSFLDVQLQETLHYTRQSKQQEHKQTQQAQKPQQKEQQKPQLQLLKPTSHTNNNKPQYQQQQEQRLRQQISQSTRQQQQYLLPKTSNWGSISKEKCSPSKGPINHIVSQPKSEKQKTGSHRVAGGRGGGG